MKVDNPTNLSAKFEGPYEIVDRPSRSQVTVKVGQFKSGQDRTLTYHWSSCKPADVREGAEVAQRPRLGRPPKSTIHDSEHIQLLSENSESISNQAKSITNESDDVINTETNATHSQLEPKKPVMESDRKRNERSTRNRNPRYID